MAGRGALYVSARSLSLLFLVYPRSAIHREHPRALYEQDSTPVDSATLHQAPSRRFLAVLLPACRVNRGNLLVPVLVQVCWQGPPGLPQHEPLVQHDYVTDHI